MLQQSNNKVPIIYCNYRNSLSGSYDMHLLVKSLFIFKILITYISVFNNILLFCVGCKTRL